MITSFCLVKTKKSEGKDKTGLFAWIRMQLTTQLTCVCVGQQLDSFSSKIKSYLRALKGKYTKTIECGVTLPSALFIFLPGFSD